MDRRQFLAGGASALLAASLPGVASAGAPRRRQIKKSLKIGMAQVGKDLVEKFQILRELGFDGVELDSPSGIAIDEALAAKEKSGLEIPGVVDSVHWSQPLSSPDAEVRAKGRAALEHALRDCKALGGSTVLLVPAVVNASVSYAEAWERSRVEIQRVLPLAAELEIGIAIENVWNNFLLSPLEAGHYVDSFESPWVSWYFDVGNVVNYGWPEQWVRILGRRISKLDVKEFSRKKRDAEGLWKGFEVEIGEGDCNWPAVMAALDEIGYEGWASAEVGGGGRERLAEIARRMDEVLAR